MRNKSDIAQRVGLVVGFGERRDVDWFDVTKDAINLLLNQMSETLSKGGRVELRGFGSFRLNTYAGGVICTRNPKTGEVRYKRRNPKVAFKASKRVRECLNVRK